MDIDRRRTPRRAFGGVVELSAAGPGVYIVAKTTEISRFGCFVSTSQSLPLGTKVSLKINLEDTEFSASGEVAYVLPGKGLGISFAAATHNDEVRLEEWLRQTGID
jgi:hypothetical protein